MMTHDETRYMNSLVIKLHTSNIARDHVIPAAYCCCHRTQYYYSYNYSATITLLAAGARESRLAFAIRYP